MSGEFERAFPGEAGRRMDVATHNAQIAERANHCSAQDWRDSRWSALDRHVEMRRDGEAQRSI